MIESSDWRLANRQLISKSIQELSYEQVLKPELLAKGHYRLSLSQGASYTFKGWQGIWGDIKVDSNSLASQTNPLLSAGQFFIDSQKETAMDDITLGNFLEEMHNSLYADLAVLNVSKKYSCRDLLSWSGDEIQSVLSGHPKILLSKGRLGWSSSDQDQFGPEQKKPLQFLYLAAKKSLCVASLATEYNELDILKESFNDLELARVLKALEDANLKLEDYKILPVHPWQYDRYLKIQFAEDFANKNLVLLGAFGDLYLPQISLRTFSNISRPEKLDIKLPLTILNTSAIRGIAAKYIPQGPELSATLSALCQSDPFLKQSQTLVLEEKAGAAFKHSLYSQVPGAPYRYQELIGAIWRQNPAASLPEGERALIVGSLFHKDLQNKSLLATYAEASGLTLSQWLKKYFEVVVLPLYHLQARYGIGLVAHGQNVVLRLKNYVPVGLYLKDFQGDLRLTESSTALNFDLTRLPPNYLIHDLITGHFVTVLRFISETLKSCEGFSETQFYRILGETIQSYLSRFPEIVSSSNFKHIDLLQPTYPRVLVNRVRFKIGYSDSAERPLPILGDDLTNPIASSLKFSEADL